MCILVAQQSAYYYYDRPRERERRAGETEQNIHIVPYRMIIYFELGFLSVFYFFSPVFPIQHAKIYMDNNMMILCTSMSKVIGLVLCDIIIQLPLHFRSSSFYSVFSLHTKCIF